ncbi:MAG TPA: VOC family protein [Halothiobacillus sp.]|nr:VOC family protein [Halothiobacillus sp.]
MTATKPIPDGQHTITPYLSIRGADAAIQFYQRIFGATEIGRLLMPGGDIGHAELQIGDTRFMLAEENPAWGNKSPTTLGGTPVTIALYVDDVDTTYQRALDAGATGIMPVKDEFYGSRVGEFADPFGHKWHVMTPLEVVSFEEMQKRIDAMFG